MSASALDALRGELEDAERCERVAVLAMWYLHREEASESTYDAFMQHFAEDPDSAEGERKRMRDDEDRQRRRLAADAARPMHATMYDADAVTKARATPARALIRSEIAAERAVRFLLEELQGHCKSALRILEASEKNAFEREKDAFSVHSSSERAVQAFYTQLQELKELYRGESAGLQAPSEQDLDKQSAQRAGRLFIEFSGEEANGQCMDLHELWGRFEELRDIQTSRKKRGRNEDALETATRLDVAGAKRSYVDYLRRLSKPQHEIIRTSAYLAYLDDVLRYLLDFAARIMPLRFLEEELLDFEKDEIEKWEASARAIVGGELCASAAELCDRTDAQALKEALRSLGLKCGGTPLERAERLRASLLNGSNEKSGSETTRSLTLPQNCALKEAQIQYLCENVLRDSLQSTILNAEKKQTLTFEELEMERKRVEELNSAADPSSDGDDADALYNPKDIPLGWDGKPIPFWLYKLHGLNHAYKCEICGNATYRGPRAFERHFSESKHVAGLQCLGIASGRNYYMITRIDDARALQRKLAARVSDAAPVEEREDAHGNLVSPPAAQPLTHPAPQP